MYSASPQVRENKLLTTDQLKYFKLKLWEKRHIWSILNRFEIPIQKIISPFQKYRKRDYVDMCDFPTNNVCMFDYVGMIENLCLVFTPNLLRQTQRKI